MMIIIIIITTIIRVSLLNRFIKSHTLLGSKNSDAYFKTKFLPNGYLQFSIMKCNYRSVQGDGITTSHMSIYINPRGGYCTSRKDCGPSFAERAPKKSFLSAIIL